MARYSTLCTHALNLSDSVVHLFFAFSLVCQLTDQPRRRKLQSAPYYLLLRLDLCKLKIIYVVPRITFTLHGKDCRYPIRRDRPRNLTILLECAKQTLQLLSWVSMTILEYGRSVKNLSACLVSSRKAA